MIEVRCFAMLREAAGAGLLELPLPEGATVADLLAEVGRRHPAVAALLGERRVLVAVNRRYAGLDTPVGAGDEVALLPPVSGG